MIIPVGSADFSVVHDVAYNEHFTNNILGMHHFVLLSEVRVVDNSLQFRNGHTFRLAPLENATMGGLRYAPKKNLG